ncbi:hypothetical protein JCM13210_16480 [Thermaerobacter litoralis]
MRQVRANPLVPSAAALCAALSPWRRRLLARHVLGGLVRGLTLAAVAAVLPLLLDRWAVDPWGRRAALGLGVVILAGTVLHLGRTRPGWASAARAADAAAGLGQQAVTAWEYAAGDLGARGKGRAVRAGAGRRTPLGRSSAPSPPGPRREPEAASRDPGAFVLAQRQRALAALAGADPRRLPLAPAGWRSWATVLVLALAVDLALWLAPHPLAPLRAQRAQWRAQLAEAREQVAAARHAIRPPAADPATVPAPGATPQTGDAGRHGPAGSEGSGQKGSHGPAGPEGSSGAGSPAPGLGQAAALEQALAGLEERLRQAEADPRPERLAQAAEAARRAADVAQVAAGHGGPWGGGSPGSPGSPAAGGSAGAGPAPAAGAQRAGSSAAGGRVSGDTGGRPDADPVPAGEDLAGLAARLAELASGLQQLAWDAAALEADLTGVPAAAGTRPGPSGMDGLPLAGDPSPFGSPPGSGAATEPGGSASGTGTSPNAAGSGAEAGAGSGQGSGRGPANGSGGAGFGDGSFAGGGGGAGGGAGGGGTAGTAGQGGGSSPAAGGSSWGTETAGSPLAGAQPPGLTGGYAAWLPGAQTPGSVQLPGWGPEAVVVAPGQAVPAQNLQGPWGAEAAQDLDTGLGHLPPELRWLIRAYFGAGGEPAR